MYERWQCAYLVGDRFLLRLLHCWCLNGERRRSGGRGDIHVRVHPPEELFLRKRFEASHSFRCNLAQRQMLSCFLLILFIGRDGGLRSWLLRQHRCRLLVRRARIRDRYRRRCRWCCCRRSTTICADRNPRERFPSMRPRVGTISAAPADHNLRQECFCGRYRIIERHRIVERRLQKVRVRSRAMSER